MKQFLSFLFAAVVLSFSVNATAQTFSIDFEDSSLFADTIASPSTDVYGTDAANGVENDGAMCLGWITNGYTRAAYGYEDLYTSGYQLLNVPIYYYQLEDPAGSDNDAGGNHVLHIMSGNPILYSTAPNDRISFLDLYSFDDYATAAAAVSSSYTLEFDFAFGSGSGNASSFSVHGDRSSNGGAENDSIFYMTTSAYGTYFETVRGNAASIDPDGEGMDQMEGDYDSSSSDYTTPIPVTPYYASSKTAIYLYYGDQAGIAEGDSVAGWGCLLQWPWYIHCTIKGSVDDDAVTVAFKDRVGYNNYIYTEASGSSYAQMARYDTLIVDGENCHYYELYDENGDYANEVKVCDYCLPTEIQFYFGRYYAHGFIDNISFVADDGENAISDIKMDVEEIDDTIYDLQGRRVDKNRMTKGLYIVGGKKVLVQ